jgi:hypothetical protein
MDPPRPDADPRAWVPEDACDEPNEPPMTRAEVIAAARAQRLEEGGLAVDAATLESVADTVMDPEYMWPGLYYTAEEAVDDVPEQLVERVQDYLRDHPEAAGGLRLGWKDGRRVVFVGFVGDVDVHRTALTSMAGDRVVVEAQQRTAVELSEIVERIDRDREALARLGYDVLVLGDADHEDRVFAEVVGGANGVEAERLFRARYGPAVEVEWLGPSHETLRPHPFGSWAAEGARLRVYFGLDHNGERFASISVAEQDAVRVVIALSRWQPVGPTTLIGGFIREQADVELDAPLGDRQVIDASTGAARPSARTFG